MTAKMPLQLMISTNDERRVLSAAPTEQKSNSASTSSDRLESLQQQQQQQPQYLTTLRFIPYTPQYRSPYRLQFLVSAVYLFQCSLTITDSLTVQYRQYSSAGKTEIISMGGSKGGPGGTALPSRRFATSDPQMKFWVSVTGHLG